MESEAFLMAEKTVTFMARCNRCGTEESNSLGADFPTVCRNCGAYAGDLTPFLLVGQDQERFVFERPSAVGGSLVLLTTGHSQFIAIESVLLAQKVEASIEKGELLKLSSSSTPGYVGFINPLEVSAILPRPANKVAPPSDPGVATN